MSSRRRVAVVALGAVSALVLAACGGGSASSSSGSSAAANGISNPSDVTGGTIRMANSGDWDSLDPADTYYAYSWNFARLYGRSLVMFKSAPGADGATLVPDLAESLGVPTDNAKTWTYKLRTGVKFEDGTPVTSKDVKYAVERSLDKDTFPNGPTYFNDAFDLQGYTSPYKDTSPDKLGLKAIETPDDQTIVFHLKSPFSGFDYFAQLPATMPVPVAKDTGTKYKEHVVSTGPYMFKTNELGKSFTLVRNPNWDQATDPNRKPLPDGYDVALNVNADDIDNRLQSGDLDVAVEGTGVGPSAQGKILADASLKKNTDEATVARLWYANINSDVAPLDNVHCRMAVEYAADKTGYQRSYGGATGGEIASNLLPPVIPGSEKFDDYATPNNAGDVAKAKDQLAQCGQPGGFSTSISYRAERPKEKATAESLQQSLAKAGINLTIKPYPSGDYFKLYAGKPDFAKANGLGIMITGWGADWPDGYGFLAQIVDSRVIRAAGNTNLGVKDPEVDAMIDKALQTTDTAAREKIWVDIDKKVMTDAYILPGIWAKGLLYRPPNLTNAFISDGFQMYDYLALGTTRK
ncbi:ABC transporter substrate-binding protein [Pseudonocardia sp. 73-21]|uniref:ABC transporter substrate-binding protein n=1 Tax=Pseudonocardia sp. 73-21 TaxID=1895809 RepID=UPI000964B0A7|nr:ABC transporter substrate-binding protein [Pseudonocardia sp. 73-21]OJY48937.1 MAG: ABC transporter substrate-binding protein [Pseudonocardia sp. 73-21]